MFLGALLLGLLMIHPFNLLCKATDKCQPIILSYYLPKKLGQEYYELFFEARAQNELNQANEKPIAKIHAKTRSLLLVAGSNGKVDYEILNVSDNDIKLRPTPYIIPPSAAKYIKFYECLCYKEHKIKKGETRLLTVKFNLDRKIEQDEEFKENKIIRIGYQL